jgi:hypothetical protein
MAIYFSVEGWQAPVRIENKKCSPEKVSIICSLQIDTLPTQKLEFIHLELACPRPKQQMCFFWQMQTLRVPISKKVTCEKKFQFFCNVLN